MSKITLTDLANLQNENTAVNAINGNNAILEAALDNTLSRDGTSPNQMGASFDMNSHRILNLPSPITTTEPLRLQDLVDFEGGSLVINSIPAGGTTGQSLVKNSATNYDVGWASASNNYFYPETYGALGNGVNDDRAAINSAAAAASAAGGGVVRYSAGKTYLLGSFQTGSVLIKNYSNVSHVGDGPSTVLKVANGLNTGGNYYRVFFPQNTTDVCDNMLFKDFTIDFNGANNGGFNHNNVGVGQYKGRNIVVDGIRFLNNPGSQNTSLGGVTPGSLDLTDVYVVNTYHYNCGDVINVSCLDHSSIYVVAENAVIANNVMTCPSQSSVNTCFDIGGKNITITNNTGTKYSKAANVSAIWSATDEVSIVSNSFRSVKYGVQYWDNPYTLSNVVVADNTFQNVTGTSAGFFDSVAQVTNDIGPIVITNNSLVSTVAAGDPSAGTASSAFQIGKGSYVIDGNLIQGFPGAGVYISTTSATSTYSITNNKIIDCGKSAFAAIKRGVFVNIGSCYSFVLADNVIRNSSTVYMTTALDLTLTATGGGAIPNNNVITNVTTAKAGTDNLSAVSANGIMYAGTNGYIYPISTASANNAVLVTSGGGTPSLSSTLPTNLVIPAPRLTSNSATSLVVGPNGTTNPVLTVDSSVASQATGVSITGAATGTSPTIKATDSGTNCGLDIASKGTGNLRFLVNSATAFFINTTQVIMGFACLVNSSGGLGYLSGAGLGSTVTQATSKSTGVTLNNITGQITMNNASLASGASVGFTVTNNTVAASDVVIVNIKSGGTADAYDLVVDTVAAGSFRISIRNRTGGALGEALVLNYAVIKGSNN